MIAPERLLPRTDGHLPIAGYAAIGGGRTAALVGIDGSVDWLCLPEFDGELVFAALLDPQRGGRLELCPVAPHDAARTYVDGTNVLRTRFSTADGAVTVTDALGVGDREGTLVRRIDGLSGSVRMAWRIVLRFGDGLTRPAGATRSGPGWTVRGPDMDVALAVHGGDGAWDGDCLAGELVVRSGDRAFLTLSSDGAPPGRDEAAAAVEDALEHWRAYRASLHYDGPWRDAVLRSAMALKLLVLEPTGAMAAAATSSLPETPGGSRNYDYRFCWPRDASFGVDAFVRLGDQDSARRFLGFFSDTLSGDADPPQPFYTLRGERSSDQRTPPLAGYAGSQPVRIGNGAAGQRQLGAYGDVLQSAALFVHRGGEIDPDLGRLLERLADEACEHWGRPDAGIWEIEPYRHHTWSKMACWVALDRAANLAGEGRIPAGHAERWRAESRRIRTYVEERCWSASRRSYLDVADGDGLDAAVLLGVFMDYPPSDPSRFHDTIDRLGEELGAGEMLWRTTQLRGEEGTFTPCSFWRVHALSRLGRLEEAAGLMDALVARANDVGLLSEELAPSGELLGNFPQALTHGALVNAAAVFHSASQD